MSAACTVDISDDEWDSIRTNIGVALAFAIVTCIATIVAIIGVSDVLHPDEEDTINLTRSQLQLACIVAVLGHTLATAFFAETNRIVSAMGPLEDSVESDADAQTFVDARKYLRDSMWVTPVPLAGMVAIAWAAINVLSDVDNAEVRRVVFRPVRDMLA